MSRRTEDGETPREGRDPADMKRAVHLVVQVRFLLTTDSRPFPRMWLDSWPLRTGGKERSC
jgi:hypothetical protein